MRLNDIYPAIQGEGAMAGTPMVLIRLMGCTVGCPWCDTKETWRPDPDNRVTVLEDALGTNDRWIDLPAERIALKARQAAPLLHWALVTGGEPAEQSLQPLVAALQAQNFKTAIETSGTALGHVGAGFDWVCVSPKLNMPGGHLVVAEAIELADEIKFVVATPGDVPTLESLLASIVLKPAVIVSLQPVSTQAKATTLCVQACMARGWRLSLQLHKYLNAR